MAASLTTRQTTAAPGREADPPRACGVDLRRAMAPRGPSRSLLVAFFRRRCWLQEAGAPGPRRRRPRSMSDPEADRDARDRTVAVRCRTRRAPIPHLRRGRPGIRATRLGRGYTQPDCRADAAGDARGRGPRAAGDHRIHARAAGRLHGGRASPSSRAVRTGRRRPGDRSAYGMGMESIQRGEMAQEAAGLPAARGSWKRPATTGSSLGSC